MTILSQTEYLQAVHEDRMGIIGEDMCRSINDTTRVRFAEWATSLDYREGAAVWLLNFNNAKQPVAVPVASKVNEYGNLYNWSFSYAVLATPAELAEIVAAIEAYRATPCPVSNIGAAHDAATAIIERLPHFVALWS